MKAGLFGGGWEDYLDALNDAFDRHVAENAPPHPFGASVDAIMTGYPDGAMLLPFRNRANTDAMVPLPLPNFVTGPDGVPVLRDPSQMIPLQFPVSEMSDEFSGMDAGPLGQGSGLQFPQGDQNGSGSDSAAFLERLGGASVPQPGPTNGDAGPSTGQRQPFIRLGQKGEMEAGESGGGYQTYGTPTDGEGQYGTAKAMQVITAVSNTLANNRDGYTPLTIGNISLAHGETWPNKEHAGHKDGLGIDVRPATVDGSGGSTTWRSQAYDRAATQRIVDAFQATGQVGQIYFNDPDIRGVTPWRGHDNHLHVQLTP